MHKKFDQVRSKMIINIKDNILNQKKECPNITEHNQQGQIFPTSIKL